MRGVLNSTPNTSFTVEFFSNTVCDDSSNGEGQTPLGTATVMTNSSGNAAIDVTLPGAVPAGRAVTATASDPSGNTSGFSMCSLVPAGLDSDGDGMSDDFDQQHFGHPTNGDPSADADGDGMNNLNEHRAGTHPKNAASVLRILSSVRNADGSATLTFSSVSGKRYRAEYSSVFGTGGTWRPLQTNIDGTGGNIPVTDTGALFEPRRFYRVLLLP